MLAAALSPQGYEKILQIVEADEVLKKSSGHTIFGRDEYYVSFLGQPSTTEPWMIQFGGHHLGLNITSWPATHARAAATLACAAGRRSTNSKARRGSPPLRETTSASPGPSSLNYVQREQAILDFQMRDLVLGPGRYGQTVEPEGTKGSA